MRAAVALAATLLLAACAHRPVDDTQRTLSLDTDAWWAHQQTVRPIEYFVIDARLSSGPIGTASLRWRQLGEEFSARLSGPFGAGAAALSGSPGAVTIRTGRDTFETPYPEAWMQAELGWSFPVAALRYWALGLPMSGTPAEYAFDDGGRLAVLEQAGWRLDYLEYMEVDGIWLPQRVQLDDGEHRALLRIDRWRETPQ